ncbi:CapA family protein [Streptomyces sp. ISL-100]|nr:CapA family protein [Streptomyces sp. ISL-100]
MTKRTRHGAVAITAAALLTAGTGCAEQTAPPARVAPAAPHQASAHSTPSAAGGSVTAPRGFTLVASGDVLPHASIIRQAKADAVGDGYDFRPMLAGVEPVVSRADLAICHMETVYGDGGPYTGYPTFKPRASYCASLG